MTHIIAKFIKHFLSYYLPVQKGLAANTILAYRDAIKLLLCYAAAAKSQCPSIDVKAVTPHTIRHTAAMHLLRAGNDVNMVSFWLGHADINTTHIYVEIDMEMKRRMLQKTSAPAVKKPLAWQKPGILQWLKQLAKMPQLCVVKY